ncbi:prepilin-type N-terminal cleavage/methylation domain-containing protein [Providencia stuartii]|uniref:Peptidase n=1 Tax=Providencia stuartii TaxID=588 RepID=A0A1S1HMT4_PROST|nr:prepilin-type N-terminal cleavage/methylation domain-containing protein [Providencia stuartii]OHT23398.1 peptidase [Providencia stuartii]
MNDKLEEQRGFAIIESMLAVVIFAMLLVALLNYTQHITLNFNWIFSSSVAVRELQSRLEQEAAKMALIPNDPSFIYPNWQINIQSLMVSDSCTSTTVSLLSTQQDFSLNRWFCRTGDSHVSGLSF